MATVYRIHPSIGVARVGNQEGTTEQDYFVGPESPGHHPVPPDGYKRDGKIKRQGARFRIYEYQSSATGDLRPVREINSDHANIRWTVRLANRKAAAQIFPPTTGNLRNASIVSPAERDRLLVLEQEDSIDSSDRGPRPLDDFFLDTNNTGADTHRVHLGDLLTDDKGRLIVLGGFGRSFSPTNRQLQNTFNNNEWCDDTADGIITAQITLNGATVPVADRPSARIIVGPPDYAPAIESMVSIYDLAEDIATRLPASGNPLPGPDSGTVSFAHHIFPILRRVGQMHWVTREADGAHAPGMQADFLRSDILQLLRNPDPTPTSPPFRARQRVMDRLAVPVGSTATPGSRPNMPLLASELDTGRELTLTLLQFGRMQRWAAGDFDPDNNIQLDQPARPFDDITDVAEQTHALDKAGLDSTVGGSFYPGIEASRVMREVSIWSAPFRIRDDIVAGSLTEGMAVPWQTDFLACGQTWWPANRPDRVKRRDPQNPSRFLTAAWEPLRTTATTFTKNDWTKVAFVVADGAAFVESERDETPDAFALPIVKALSPGGVKEAVRIPFNSDDFIVVDDEGNQP
jgi:L-Lysine epsilon oxidase N-terminal/L-lysine epsilon oxidase C-terminal domain